MATGVPLHITSEGEDPARGTYFRKLEDLKTVPAEYFNLPATSRTKLLRQETHVTLTDIKQMYKDAHGNSEEVEQQLLYCDISADGVAESKSGARTFVVVSIRIGTCKLMAATRPSTHWPYRPGEPVEYRTTEESKYFARYIVGVWSENVKITIIF